MAMKKFDLEMGDPQTWKAPKQDCECLINISLSKRRLENEHTGRDYKFNLP